MRDQSVKCVPCKHEDLSLSLELMKEDRPGLVDL